MCNWELLLGHGYHICDGDGVSADYLSQNVVASNEFLDDRILQLVENGSNHILWKLLGICHVPNTVLDVISLDSPNNLGT